MDDFTRIGEKVPVLADLKPSGAYTMSKLVEIGGVTPLMKRLLAAGMLHADCMTVTGKTMAENLDAVSEYLYEYPGIVELLPLVCEISRKHVGVDTELSLEVCQSPADGTRDLSLYIRPRHYSEKLFETISDIEAEYIDKLAEKSGWILVTTDFQNPQQT